MAYENLQYKSKKILFYLYLEWHHTIQVNAMLKIMVPNQILLIKKKNMRIIKIIICALCHHIFFILKILAPSILIKLLEMRKKKVSNYFNYIIEILFLILYKFRGGKKQKNEGLM